MLKTAVKIRQRRHNLIHKRGLEKHFDDFVKKRCESIMVGNKKYWGLMQDISLTHEKLKSKLRPEDYKDLIQLEQSYINMQTHSESLIYKGCLKDIFCIRQIS